jgi:DNA modification methylase
MIRVTKPTGSIWVNLGDKYVADNRGSGGDKKRGEAKWAPAGPAGYPGEGLMPRKSLMGIPWRYAIRAIDELGLILRAEVIWSKVNGVPESVTDRVRRSHEVWFHFTLQPRYFSAVDEIREESLTADHHARYGNRYGREEERRGQTNMAICNPLGKLPGSVWDIPEGESLTRSVLHAVAAGGLTIDEGERILAWSTHTDSGQTRQPAKAAGNGTAYATATGTTDGPTATVNADSAWPLDHARTEHAGPPSVWQIATQPLRVPDHLGVDHFAAFPMEFPRRIIRGWSPAGVCTACGEGRRPVVTRDSPGDFGPRDLERKRQRKGDGPPGNGLNVQPTHLIGYACGCPDTQAPTTPAVVLDPFGGTGTTALVAKALGRTGITVDLSGDYCRLAEWRTNDPRELAAALQVDKPAPVHDGQLDLLDGLLDLTPPPPTRPMGGLAYANAHGRT